MNTADAETLSQRVVKSMFDADILLPEEEWVKFGGGDITGVLWQLTGSGCYAPKVHEQEIHGRCYSHHCTRTLKKINLQTHVLEPSRKSEDWVTFFKLTKESLEGTTKKEIEDRTICMRLSCLRTSTWTTSTSYECSTETILHHGNRQSLEKTKSASSFQPSSVRLKLSRRLMRIIY